MVIQNPNMIRFLADTKCKLTLEFAYTEEEKLWFLALKMFNNWYTGILL
jgi:hypothetical protein